MTSNLWLNVFIYSSRTLQGIFILYFTLTKRVPPDLFFFPVSPVD